MERADPTAKSRIRRTRYPKSDDILSAGENENKKSWEDEIRVARTHGKTVEREGGGYLGRREIGSGEKEEEMREKRREKRKMRERLSKV